MGNQRRGAVRGSTPSRLSLSLDGTGHPGTAALEKPALSGPAGQQAGAVATRELQVMSREQSYFANNGIPRQASHNTARLGHAYADAPGRRTSGVRPAKQPQRDTWR